jgi:hypothetical protein
VNRLRLADYPWHPILAVSAHVLATYVASATSLAAVGRPMAVGVAVGAALLAASTLITRSLLAGGIFATAAFVVLRSTPGQAGAALAMVVGASGVAFLMLHWRRTPHRLRLVTRALNTAGVMLIALLAVSFLTAGRAGELGPDLGLRTEEADRSPDIGGPTGAAGLPDIYVIMLDGYPRADTLQRIFGFDNAPFLRGLEDRGLQVSNGSRSNYMYTMLTMGSMLNMRHIQDLDGVRGEDDLRLAINHNPVFTEMRRRGYTVVATASGWEAHALRSADAYCGDEPMNDYELHLIGPTLLGQLLEIAWPSWVADRDRHAVEAALDCIPEWAEADVDGPRFLLAHVPSPHLPVVFDADGGPADPKLYGHAAGEVAAGWEAFLAGYGRQLQYLNGRVLAAIDAVQAATDEPPVIVVLSDHGSEALLNWDNALRSDLDERFATLFAASTPGVRDLFGQEATPVNLFSRLLNHYFGTDVPLAHDGAYVSTVQDRLSLSPAPPGVAAPR